MISSSLVFGLQAALIALGLLIAYRAGRLRDQNATGRRGVDAVDPDAETNAVDPDAEAVRCPQCDVENERGYRYCRSCVSRLPGATGLDRSSDASPGRVVR
jgi:hypothetical protein